MVFYTKTFISHSMREETNSKSRTKDTCDQVGSKFIFMCHAT